MMVVNQWLSGWDRIPFKGSDFRNRPPRYFYIFSIPILDLKRLTGIVHRDRPDSKAPADEVAVQRRHIPDRSLEILRFIKLGFPLSKQNKRIAQNEREILQMPGWLPTSVLVNISGSRTESGSVAKRDVVTIEHEQDSNIAYLHLPTRLSEDNWIPDPTPFQMIDGQHRLWAMDREMKELFEESIPPDIAQYEIPVVAFRDLAPTWQAYLFYTINQLPKRIDTSLAFDLYPLLRTQEWLLRFEGPGIYRETRAQELVTSLWSHPRSVWLGRILRFGGRKRGYVTQAAFVRALLRSFIRSYDPRGRSKIGGLFGSRRNEHKPVLNWDRDQQAAFLILCWEALFNAVRATKSPWAKSLRSIANDKVQKEIEELLEELDIDLDTPEVAEIQPRKDVLAEKAFSGPQSLIATDQGIRSYSSVVNDLIWVANEDKVVDLENWVIPTSASYGERAIGTALDSFARQAPKACRLLESVAVAAADFDWRLAAAVPPTDAQHDKQASYLGSGGYKRLHSNLMAQVGGNAGPEIKSLFRKWRKDLTRIASDAGDE